MGFKKWVLKSYDKEAANVLCRDGGFSGALSVLLSGRGINIAEQALDFLNSSGLSVDPFSFADMERAVERINEAIDSGEKITVYGDYDADGVTATALLYSYLEARGAQVDYYIPQREGEGYGLHKSSVDKLCEAGTQLIVTVDNGISSIDEVEYINSLGMQVIVTDHHTPDAVLPNAVAVVNPHRSDCPSSFKLYAGVGVAFKLVQALEGDEDGFMLLDEYADLFALGTIGDVVSLTGENRSIVKYGLELLLESNRLGIRALIDVSGMTGRRLNGINVAFSLVPRINAAGRMGSPERAVRLLLTNDEEQAMQLAAELENDNRRRQEVEHDIFLQAEQQIESDEQIANSRVLVLSGEGWHRGVIGIVATRICEKYGRPCIMISIDSEDAKGSGRSIEGFSLYEAIKHCSDHLLRFGGHTLAAGLNIKTEEIPIFRKMINEYAQRLGDMPVQQLCIDFKLNPLAVNLGTLNDISLLEPFGNGNPSPVFGLYNMQLQSVQPLSSGKHIKLTVKRGDTVIQAVRFNYPYSRFSYRSGDIIDLAVTLDKNEFRGEVGLSVIIKDIHPNGFDGEKFLQGINRYNAYLRREQLSDFIGEIIPTRQDIAAVYRFIRENTPIETESHILYHRLCNNINMTVLLISLDILSEMGLISYKTENDVASISLIEVEQKVNLDDSAILSGLRKMGGRA